jgi:uncharacterized protein (TIGR00297 family)
MPSWLPIRLKKPEDYLSASLAAFAFAAFGVSGNSTLVLTLFVAGSAWLAVYLRWLTAEAGFSATTFGLLVAVSATWPGLIFTAAFFITGSIWARNLQEKKGGRRPVQVWANGGVYAVLLFAHAQSGHHFLLIGALASLTCAASDTAASAAGTRFGNPTYDILTWRKTNAGIDGGVSLAGTMAALGVAVLFSVLALLLFTIEFHDVVTICAIGFSGSIVDSYLGRLCQQTGNRFSLTNDGVNALSTAVSGLFAGLLTNYGMV